MMERKMMVVIIAAVIATIWLFAGYAAAQENATSAKAQAKKLDEVIKKAAKEVTKDGKGVNEFAKLLGQENIITVFINAEDGSILMPLSETLPNCNSTKSEVLDKFVDAVKGKGNNKSIAQFFHYKKNPYCVWYVDSQGVLRQRCIP